MLEIIALIFLTKMIGQTASKKGLPPGRWKLYTVLAWFGFEMVGFVLGTVLFGNGNLIGLFLFALFCAFGGFLFIKARLESMPDDIKKDIDSIGR